MMDSADPAVAERIEALLVAVPGIERVGAVRARWIGHRLRVEAEVVVDRRCSISEAHDIVEAGRHALFHGVSNLGDAFIHADPCDHDGSDPHAAVAHHVDHASHAYRPTTK
jgi:divalent metal cation (Fe/Co/Zn/Cd) transporter